MHATYSRRAARRLRAQGQECVCLADLVQTSAPTDVAGAASAIADRWQLPTFRDLYRADPALLPLPEAQALELAVRQALAVERLLDDVRPRVVVPEVGRETFRIAAHHAALSRSISVFFLFFTIFPRPLRLYVDTMQAPIVSDDEVRPLSEPEAQELDDFRKAYLERDAPIRAYRTHEVSGHRLRAFVRHLIVKAGPDRDNVYLRPRAWLQDAIVDAYRARAVERQYEDLGDRPFVYFPLHVADDYKLEYLIPHLADQFAVARQIAMALPAGVDLVLKEHPMSIGRNDLHDLRRVRRLANVRLVPAQTSSHTLIRRSRGVAVISSTVGLEALLHGRPVLTLGEPFYARLGVTRDVRNLSDVRRQVPLLLQDRPDRERIDQVLGAAMRACRPGAPVLVDRSPENARCLAESLIAAVAP